MELRGVGFERYKGYGERAELELAPLTVLVGANDSGKSALARAIPLVAGGLALAGNDPVEPLPLDAGGLHHGGCFEDLLTGRTVHGSLSLSLSLSGGGRELSLDATVQNVVASNQSSERQITEWRLRSDADDLVAKRVSLDDDSRYENGHRGTGGTRRERANPSCWPIPPSDRRGAGTRTGALRSRGAGERPPNGVRTGRVG